MAAETPRLDARSIFMLLALSVLWGGSFFFAGIAVRELPPLTIVLARVSLAALLLLPVLWISGHALPRGWAGWLPFIVMGLFNNVIPFSLIVFGQKHIASGLASVVNATTPLFTVLVLAAAGDERLTAGRIAGVLIGLVGVAILRGPDLSLTGSQTIGIGLCLGAALSYGLSGLWGRRRLAGVPPLVSATCQLMSSSLLMALLAGAVEQPWTLAVPSRPAVLALIGLAVLATAVAYLLFFAILVRAGASNVMLVTLLIPVTAILLGSIYLGEVVSPREIAGAFVIASALIIFDGRILAWLKVRLSPAGT